MILIKWIQFQICLEHKKTGAQISLKFNSSVSSQLYFIILAKQNDCTGVLDTKYFNSNFLKTVEFKEKRPKFEHKIEIIIVLERN